MGKIYTIFLLIASNFLYFGESALCDPEATICVISKIQTTQNNKNLPLSADDMSSVTTLKFKSSVLAVFPENLFDIFTDLEVLEIKQCGIQTIETFGSATSAKSKVKTLNLSENKVSKLNDYVFARAEQLMELDLSQNLISDLKDKAFVGLKKLKTLRLTDNRITKLPNNIFIAITSIRTMYLDNNQIAGLDPIIFRNNKELRELFLNKNRGLLLTKTTFYANSKAFTDLMSNNKVLNSFFRNNPHVLQPLLSNLISLSLSKNHLNSLNIDDFPILKNLKQLNVASNSLVSIKNIRSIAKQFPALRSIDVSDNNWDCSHLELLIDSIKPVKVSNEGSQCVQYFKVHGKSIDDLKTDLQHSNFRQTVYVSITGTAIVMVVCLIAVLYCWMKRKSGANHIAGDQATTPGTENMDESNMCTSGLYVPMNESQPYYEDIKFYEN